MLKKNLPKMFRTGHKVIKSQDVHELFCPKHLLIFVLIEPFFDKYLVVCIIYNIHSTYIPSGLPKASFWSVSSLRFNYKPG